MNTPFHVESGYILNANKKKTGGKPGSSGGQGSGNGGSKPSGNSQNAQNKKSKKGKKDKVKTCFKCGSTDHLKKDCPELKKNCKFVYIEFHSCMKAFD